MTATIRACAQCRTVLLPGESRCLVCGADSERLTRPCPLCGHEAPLEARFCTQCGQDLQPPPAKAAPSAAAEPVSEPEFVKVRNPGARFYTGFGATVLVLLALVSVQSFVAATFFTPQRAVTGYFDALTARDAGAALSFLAPGEADSGGVLLTDAVLKHEGYQPPLNITVADVPAEGDRRLVPVGFELDGQSFQLQVTVRRAENKTLGVFRGWLVEGGLLTLVIAATGGVQATVNGVAVPENPTVFPGRYRMGLVDNPLLQVGQTTATVAGPIGGQVRLAPTVKDSARREVETQVRSYVDDCARKPELRPAGCPFAVTAGTDVANVGWTIRSYPALSFNVSPETGSVSVSTEREGRAEATGVLPDGTAFARSDGFRVNGTAALVDGKLSFTSR